MRLLRTVCVSLVLAAVASACSPAGKADGWITFLSRRNGNSVLYRMHPDGRDVQAVFGGELRDAPGLSQGMKLYRQPHWSLQSPDGAYFLSWAIDLGEPLKRYRISARYLLQLGRLDGGPTRVITPDSDEVFAWAPDSQRFVYTRSLVRHPANINHPLPPRSEVVITALDGSSEDVVLDRSGIWAVHDWSIEGKRLLVSYQTSHIIQGAFFALFELDLDGAMAEMTRVRSNTRPMATLDSTDIPSGGGLRVVLPLSRKIGGSIARYAPDGKSIAVIYSSLESPRDELIDPEQWASSFDLRLIDLASGKARILFREPDIFAGPICWSPDGRQILFARYDKKDLAFNPGSKPPRAGDGSTIWSIDRDGTNLRKITTGWCPDWR